jgi:uncharacterized tellurite resistance protein B-like protein
MNISFLPRTIKEQLEKNLPSILKEDSPADVVRSTTSGNGESGESYIISLPGTLYIYSRIIGDFDFKFKKIEIAQQIKHFDFKEEKYRITLELQTEAESFTFIFSSFDIEDLEKIKKNVNFYIGKEPGVCESSEDASGDVSPFQSKLEMLAAALMFLSTVDNQIDTFEDKYIANLFTNNQEVLANALRYFKTHSFDQFLNDCLSLSDEESLCILTHLMELGFADSSLHTSEQQLIKKFCIHFKIPNETYDAVTQIIFAKNNLSILF